MRRDGTSADQKAREWAAIEEIEKDFFHELQFVPAQVRRMKCVGTDFAIVLGLLIRPLPILILAIKDFWKRPPPYFSFT
jgi:hypothetical protein